MKSSLARALATLAIAVVVLVYWLVPMPSASVSTYAAVGALLLGVGSVVLFSWRNARPVETIGQVLQRTEVEGSTRRR
jgi:hypothetical protein